MPHRTAPLIAHANRDFSVRAATHSDINLLPRIFLVAVDNRIGESFSYCRFDVFLGSIRKTVLPNETPDKRNELIDEWRDFRTFTGERPPDFDESCGVPTGPSWTHIVVHSHYYSMPCGTHAGQA